MQLRSVSQTTLLPHSITLPPPLKWAGGKRWLIPTLAPIWKRHSERRLVEPFAGGLAVALGLRPTFALLNDNNPHLVNFYRWLKQGKVPDPGVSMEHDAKAYYAHRKRFNDLILGGRANTLEAASLFYYLNRTAYNGLCRFSAIGIFNVPFGRYRTINYASKNDFSVYIEALKGWEFSNRHFRELVLEPDDFVYADPPYDVEFRSYSAGGFSWDEQKELAQWLSAHPGPVVASNQATNRVIELYTDLGFHIRTLEGPRRISCTGDRSPALEMLASKRV